ncbi:alkaline phosphatase family protein, partial [Candidatus Woesearchaeota archaeon]|nr:alkaline phosphatase family protein [Candidatus Woesearchaeota archaeon]
MVLPDYKKGSIVNLMSSIEKAMGGKPVYNPLPQLPPKMLKKYNNVVLMILDGLGYEYIKKHGKGTVFKKNLKAKITSVFPSTTASAITAFITGIAPQQHAVIGWFMYLKEIGAVTIPLRFSTRVGGIPLENKIKQKEIFHQKPIFNRIKSKPYAVLPAKFVSSCVTKENFGKRTKRKGYNTIDGFFNHVKKIIKSNNKKKFIHAYWPDFDTKCHKFGVKSNKTNSHFKQLNKKINHLVKSIEKTNTLVIITADHGLIDSPKNKRILINKHPELAKTLAMPLCGDVRSPQCYVHPSKTKEFEKYVKTKLKNACTLYKRKEMINKNYFGLKKPNPKLLDRTGDYVLITKNNYMIRDFILGEKKKI